MTWPLTSFTILGLALFAGFWWYERSHPTSKVLALVATLAALAALGRIAFAPLPNVKPTTDIVLLSGYVLGGAPGFAVGAVGAIASNIVFGQGPWTPWQMGAWGLCGLIGAGVGVLSGRRLGRWPLAFVCLGAGLLYGAILDFSTWVTYSGSHTLAQYVTISATSLSFNIAHAVGNLMFCLAFGPVFIRALMRYRARFEITWEEEPVARPVAAGGGLAPVLPTVALLAVLSATALAVAGTGAPAAEASARSTGSPTATAAASAVSRAGTYLARSQNRDGGFGPARGTASTPLFSSWAVMGLRAAGRTPSRTRRGTRTATSRLIADARRVRATGDLERTILAVRAAGLNPRRVGGRDLVRALLAKRDRDGSFDGLTNLSAFGVLALRAGGRSASDSSVVRAARFVQRQQNRDGGFNFARRGSASGVDDTGAAIQALVAARRGRGKGGAISRAVSYLRRRQNSDGGFGAGAGSGSNAQSTAFAVQGLLAAGVNPDRVKRRGSRSPMAYLRSLMASNGSVRYSRTRAQTPVWVTSQAVLALARKPFPLR
ncbi:prenyltransferase/squalene oxidase repeat-containing protein [Paraconexibacter sp.]|uniref:prenyltransferase/squalene oxidase repeat-containing protein n=1 Tax=Paraconexibacter sp. TaxID=2949640 RepID=UPI003565F52B